MGALLISESHIGSHLPPLRGIDFLSLQGTRGVFLNREGRFELSEGLKNTLKNYRLVLVGTDLDVEGTKTATVIKNFCGQIGVKAIRLAFTEKGYVKIGGFLSSDRLGVLEKLARLNRYWYSKYGYGYKSVMVLGRAYRDYLAKVNRIKVLNPKGTSTVTILVKGSLKGISPYTAYKLLNHLYREGVIEYPRVDNDYIPDKPYDLYPHPPLPRNLGKRHEIFAPIGKDSLPLDRNTYLLRLSNLRLITPSTATKYLKNLEYFFDEDLTPYKSRKKRRLLEIFASISERYEDGFKKDLEAIFYPQLKLSPPVPLVELLSDLGEGQRVDWNMES